MIRVEDDGAVRRVVLDRPERKNAVTREGWDALRSAFEDFAASEQRVLVITGAGGDFCAGADLTDVDPAELATAAGRIDRMRRVSAAALALHRVPKPTVAAVDGVAAGAGLNLALGCDMTIATARARFSEIFVRRGLTLDFGGSWLLPRRVGLQRAKELAFTGRMVDAAEAVRIGLVLRVVEPEDLDEAVETLARELAEAAPLAVRFAKEGLDRSSAVTMEEALDLEATTQAHCLASDDALEGVQAFLERRAPDFQGR